jgi:hypothetical protein
MGEKRKLWIGFNHLKALTALAIFTPIIKLFGLSPQAKIDVQFYWMLMALIVSPFARFYR